MSDGNAKVALVTGGAKRVGRAIVERLADSGWNVVFTYYSSEAESNGLQELYWDHKNERYLVQRAIADLSELDDFEFNITSKVETCGRLDLLVNCASVYKPDPSSFDKSFFREIFTVNVEAPLRLCQRFAPMLKASHGRVVNMIDILAERPWPAYRTYCASKAALANLTLSLARELAPEVTVNGIAPGVVEWPPGYPDSEKQKYLNRVPLSHAGTPQDVANLVHFLATEGSYITGQIIRLDGGRSIT
jgi:pteridine reductase